MYSLEAYLWDYFGQLNEIQAGVKPKPEDVLEKPEALIRYELAQSLRIPYVRGGLQDQPYIWMKEHAVITTFLETWNRINQSQQQ